MKYLHLSFLLFFQLLCFAHENESFIVTGHVQSVEEIIAYDILVLNRKSTAVAGNSFTTPEFKLALPDTGRYTLVISGAQFETISWKVAVARDTTYLDPIPLQTNTLKGTVVSASKPTFQYEGTGKLKVNVEGSPLASHGNATTTLERIPGVKADKDGNVSLSDGSAVTFFLNGRIVRDPAVLQSIQAQDIATIVVDKTPSPRYNADTQAGIFITTRKKTKDYLDVDIGNTTLVSKGFGNDIPISLSGKTGTVSAHLSLTPGLFNHSLWQVKSKLSQYDTDGSTLLQDITNNNLDVSRKNLNAFFLFNHAPNPKHEYGLQYTGILQQENIAQNINEEIDGVSDQYGSFSGISGQTHNMSINYSHKLEEKHTISFVGDLTYSQSAQNIIAEGSVPADIAAGGKYTIGGINADYALSTGTFSCKAGLSASGTRKRNESTYNDLQSTALLTEWLLSAYISVDKAFHWLQFSAGIRAEYGMTVSGLHYFQPLPTLSVTKPFGEIASLSLTYKCSAIRPNYEELSPEILYINSITYKQGNPSLLPCFRSDVRLTGRWKNLSAYVGYRLLRDKTNLTYITNNTQENITMPIKLTWMNANKVHSLFAGLDASFSWRCFQVMASSYFRKDFHTFDFLGQMQHTKRPLVLLEIMANYAIGNWSEVSLSYEYTSPCDFLNDVIQKSQQLNFEFTAHLFKGMLAATVGIKDIFHTVHYEAASIRSGFLEGLTLFDRPDTRMAYLTLRFHFGKAKVNVERKSANQEALNRL